MALSWISGSRPSRNASSPRRAGFRKARPCVEGLEGRQLLTTFSVTNVNDTGAGSLRQAILGSNATAGTTLNTINFKIGAGGVQTIALKSALPTLTHAVLIDGTTQAGTGSTPRIVLDGTLAGPSAVGLTLKVNGATVKGLAIDAFSSGGVLVDGASMDTITNDFIGVTAAGNVAKGNGVFGVELRNGASSNVVYGSIISGNVGNEVVITGKGTTKNTIDGDFINTDSTGTVAIPTLSTGIVINLGASNNTIGGLTTGARDVISGSSTANGLVISNTGTTGNVVEGNFIGTDFTGLKALANGGSGIVINQGATGNTIGGTAAGARNVISGNHAYGIFVTDAGTMGNTIAGNFIGTDATGLKALANLFDGVDIASGATYNMVGGTTTAARNVISGNATDGLQISNSGATGNVVQGNFIGTDATGVKALGNSRFGVLVQSRASGNIIGGTAAGAGNLVSGNASNGVQFSNAGTSNNIAQGNTIGLAFGGTSVLPNLSGVVVNAGATGNTIGGSTAGARNVVSGNTGYGILVGDAGTSNNLVAGNYVGTDVTGLKLLGIQLDGIAIVGGATNTTVGGTTALARNVVVGNTFDGVQISDTGTTGNFVEGNFIGTDATGLKALGNHRNGVMIQNGASGNTIGGAATGAGNTISGNVSNGVQITNAGSSNNTVLGNVIGLAFGGEGVLPNGNDGVVINSGASNNTIGSTTVFARNVISGNGNNGVEINASNGNVVAGDLIGTDITGNFAQGNRFNGVLINQGASGNTIGGTTGFARDVISANGAYGILIGDSGTSNNTVLECNVGTVANGAGPLANHYFGVAIVNGAANNNVGSSNFNFLNVIENNDFGGVAFNNAGGGNVISGDIISLNGNNQPNANVGSGVVIISSPFNTVINCTIQANRDWGIAFTASSNPSLSGNMFANNVLGDMKSF